MLKFTTVLVRSLRGQSSWVGILTQAERIFLFNETAIKMVLLESRGRQARWETQLLCHKVLKQNLHVKENKEQITKIKNTVQSLRTMLYNIKYIFNKCS